MYFLKQSNLFESFISNNKKVQPALASDWKMNPRGATPTTITLSSESTGQEVVDIKFDLFLNFVVAFNLTIKGKEITGEFVIGSDRSLYTPSEFEQWQEKYVRSSEIKVKDMTPGFSYKTPSGRSFIYLGHKYVSTLKTMPKKGLSEGELYEGLGVEFSKVKKVHYKVTLRGAHESLESFENSFEISPIASKEKYVEEVREELSKEEINNFFCHFRSSNPLIACFEDKKPKEEKYKLTEVFFKKRSALYYNTKALLVEFEEREGLYGVPLFGNPQYDSYGSPILYYPVEKKEDSYEADNYKSAVKRIEERGGTEGFYASRLNSLVKFDLDGKKFFPISALRGNFYSYGNHNGISHMKVKRMFLFDLEKNGVLQLKGSGKKLASSKGMII